MIDKGFDIKEECAARFIAVHVPPGNSGQSQMLPKDINKTNDIAKLRILVEQVIRRFKPFNLIVKELPISFVSNLNGIIVICAIIVISRYPFRLRPTHCKVSISPCLKGLPYLSKNTTLKQQ